MLGAARDDYPYQRTNKCAMTDDLSLHAGRHADDEETDDEEMEYDDDWDIDDEEDLNDENDEEYEDWEEDAPWDDDSVFDDFEDDFFEDDDE